MITISISWISFHFKCNCVSKCFMKCTCVTLARAVKADESVDIPLGKPGSGDVCLLANGPACKAGVKTTVLCVLDEKEKSRKGSRAFWEKQEGSRLFLYA